MQAPQTKQSGYYDTDAPTDLHGPFDGAQAAASAAEQDGVPEVRVCVFRWADRQQLLAQFEPNP